MAAGGYETRISPAFRVTYCGFSVLDFNYSASAFRWIVAELLELVPFGQETIQLSIRNESGKSKIIGTQCNADSVVLEHDVEYIWKFFPYEHDGRCFAYLIRTDPDFPFTCHVFYAVSVKEAHDIIALFRQAVQARTARLTSNDFGNWLDFEKDTATSRLSPIQSVPSSPLVSSIPPEQPAFRTANTGTFASHFEVHYLCRVEINGSSPTSLVVDEAARRYDEEYRTNQVREYVAASVKSLIGDRKQSREIGSRNKLGFYGEESDERRLGEDVDKRYVSPVRRRRSSSLVIEALVDSVFLNEWHTPMRKKGFHRDSTDVVPPSLADIVKARASSNRSMLLIIGRNDVTFISLDHKQELLHKKLTEISCVIQGSKYANHFAFVCPDNWQSGRSDCFVIRCQDSTIASAAIRAMRTAFTAAFNEHASAGGRQHVCGHCPLYQFSCLCTELDGFKPRKIHDIVVNRISQLPIVHQEMIWSGYKKIWNESAGNMEAGGDSSRDNFGKNSNNDNVKRKNVMMMSILRSVCESAQVLHARSVGKLFTGTAGGNATAATASTGASSENAIYLIDVSSGTNSRPSAQAKSNISQCENASTTSRFSAANKLVSLREKARNAFGGSLDSFIKRKLNNNDNDVGGLTRTVDIEEAAVPSSDGETGNTKPFIVVFDDDVQCLRQGKNEEEGEEISDIPSTPPTPASPTDTMSSQATFHFETPDRRGSDSDIYYRPRSCTVGDVFPLSASNSGQTPVASKRITQDKHTQLTKHRNSNDRSNSSLVNMTAMQRGRRMSWRQAIFSRVVSPRLFASRHSVAGLGPLLNDSPLSECRRNSGSTTNDTTPSSCPSGLDDFGQPSPYKSLWKKAIMEQILTMRLENQKKSTENGSDEVRKLKLTYEEITPCSEDEARPVWLEMLRHPKRSTTRFDRIQLEEAVKAGVPRDLRCEVWKLLMSQHMLDRGKRAQMEIPPAHRYRDLLKDLTSYQHAILIDLGRTFPTHGYFSQPLGNGQLSLFNILKAYSLFDVEVGYCQGLSFIAGVLLLHVDEEDAFEMLVDMMYRMQLRKQYRPDMMALQIEMYQLSRLLHDRHKDLHLHLEEHEIPILYAAPWFLTLFASAFPLGFVARVFDFVFLAGGLDVVFKIALILLGDHKELIKNCDSFESINDFLKTTLPAMSLIQMERIFNQVFELDISRELLAYEVEYHVLQEEVLANPLGPPLCANVSLPIGIPAKQFAAHNASSEQTKLDTANKYLKRQNMELLEQLQEAHYKLAVAEKTRLEMEAKMDATNDLVNSYQCKVNGFERRIEALEMERRSLLSALQRLRNDAPADQKEPHSVNNGIPESPPRQTPSSLPLNRPNSETSTPNPHSTNQKLRNSNNHRS